MDVQQTLLDFIAKYNEMRKAQKSYFKTKNQGVLIRSKQLELDLDADAIRILDEMAKELSV